MESYSALISTNEVIKDPWGSCFYVRCAKVVEQPTTWYMDDHHESTNFKMELKTFLFFQVFFMTRFLHVIFTCINIPISELFLLFVELLWSTIMTCTRFLIFTCLLFLELLRKCKYRAFLWEVLFIIIKIRSTFFN